jgi:FkbM family methyltransferase
MRIWLAAAAWCRRIADVGANRGVYALAARATNAGAIVYALEPVPSIFQLLKVNLQINGFADVRALPVAASDQDGTATLFNVAGSDTSYIGSLEESNFIGRYREYVRIDVPTRRLQSIVEGDGTAGLDLVKIDVEGHEEAVIEGLGPILARDRPMLLLEVLSEERAARLQRLLAGNGYLFFDIDESAKTITRAMDLRPPSHGFNCFACSPADAARLGL